MKQHSLCGIHLLFTDCYVIGSQLLSDWLIVCDVAKLDSALCRSGRDKFLELISSTGVNLFTRRWYGNARNAMFSWLLLRHGKIPQLSITDEVAHNTLERYIREQGRYVRELSYFIQHYHSVDHEDLLAVAAEHCVSLKHLRLSSAVSPAYIAALLCGCRSLVEVDIRPFDLANLIVLREVNRGLQRLTISIDVKDTAVSRLNAIAEFSALEKLHLHFRDCTNLAAPLRTIAMARTTLVDVSMTKMTEESAKAFVQHCPHMRRFATTVAGALTPLLLNTVADCWHNLDALVLESARPAYEWSDALDAAVLNVVTRLCALTLLVCVNGKLPPFIDPVAIEDTNANPASVPAGASALRTLCVTRSSAGVLESILQLCPALTEVVHAAEVASAVLGVLAASGIKRISCSGSDLHGLQFQALHALESLRMWNAPSGWEDVLTAMAKRSPGLKVLNLEFWDRPLLSLFPDMLRYLPALEELVVTVTPPTGGNSLQGNENFEYFVDDAAGAVEAFVRLLRPSLDFVKIDL
jgi:hypothetical protein